MPTRIHLSTSDLASYVRAVRKRHEVAPWPNPQAGSKSFGDIPCREVCIAEFKSRSSALPDQNPMSYDRPMSFKPVDPGKLPPWKRNQPPGKSRPLSDVQKRAARARADQAGRRYPNLVDNMWAARNVPRGDD